MAGGNTMVSTKRVELNGRAEASQAYDEGSIPFTRSNVEPTLLGEGVRSLGFDQRSERVARTAQDAVAEHAAVPTRSGGIVKSHKRFHDILFTRSMSKTM